MISERSRLHELRAALAAPAEDEVLDQALTHRSYSYEHGGLPPNERLEFLGDSVLGLVVTERLYRAFPDLPEGRLAKLRAAVVNARALAGVARELELGGYLHLGRGEEASGGRHKASILADALEAVIGAIYLGGGLDAARAFIDARFAALIERAAQLGAGLDWKTSLQEAAAAAGLGQPEYVVSADGPDHARTFHAKVRVGEEFLGEGFGGSKKMAEQDAAEEAYLRLGGSQA